MSDPSESITRAERIDGQLGQAGWDPNGINFEKEFKVGSKGDPDHGFADYLLNDSRGLPLAVVEAKRSSKDAIAGKEQASEYCGAIEERTGARPFVFLANGNEIWYWDRSSNPRMVSGFLSRDELERRRFQRDHSEPLESTRINPLIVNRPYQHEAVRRAQELFTGGRRRALWVMATGTGKTRTAMALIDTLLKAKWIETVLFLTDRTALRGQAFDAMRDHLPAEPAQVLTSSTYEPTKRLYVATLQTMQDFHQEFSPGAFDLIISDEAHRSIYNLWRVVFDYFDARLLGLTATPADFIDRNTFEFFGCPPNRPTFAYEFEQAVKEDYLVDYEAYHARTIFQVEGIHGTELDPEQRQELLEAGIDPEDIDFEGTELERKVTNVDTTRRLVSEFFEQSVKEPGGVLPSKSIIFAMGHSHARRLWMMFNEEFPQHAGLAEIIDSHVERPDRVLKRFRTESMPRIAISIDMLDTGVDIPTVANLGFMKPVFSRIKFWQMIGRGTRKVDEENEKPWCPAGSKERFRILDFWENFERFRLNPEGVEPTTSTPVTVRYFRQLVKCSHLADQAGRQDLRDYAISELRRQISELPVEAAGVREERLLVEQVTQDAFWADLAESRRNILIHNVAPLMRHLGDVDLQAVTFGARCLEVINSILANDLDRGAIQMETVQADLNRLPREHPAVSPKVGTITQVAAIDRTELADSLEMIWEAWVGLSDLIHLKLKEPSFIVTLNLQDALREQRWIVVGPEANEFEVSEYVEAVEAKVRALAETHPAMIRLATGEQLTDEDVNAIEALLDQPELHITEETLQDAYRAPHGSLVGLIRHALGVEQLPSREDAIREAFESFISEKGYLHSDQIRFVRLFASRLTQAGEVKPLDLYEAPFTYLGLEADRQLPSSDVEGLFALAAQYEIANA